MRSIVSEEISVSDLSADSKKKRKKERERKGRIGDKVNE